MGVICVTLRTGRLSRCRAAPMAALVAIEHRSEHGLGGPNMITNLQRRLQDWLLTVDGRMLRALALRIMIVGLTSGILGILIANRL